MTKYEVVGKFKMGNDTAVIISGDGFALKNNIPINDGRYKLLSIGMLNSKEMFKRTALLIKGHFNEKEVYV